MVSTPDEGTDNIPMSPSQYVTLENPIAIKLLRPFLEALDIKNNSAVHRFVAAKSKYKAIRARSNLCSIIYKLRVHRKINQQFKEYLYRFILHNTQVVQSSMANYCI